MDLLQGSIPWDPDADSQADSFTGTLDRFIHHLNQGGGVEMVQVSGTPPPRWLKLLVSPTLDEVASVSESLVKRSRLPLGFKPYGYLVHRQWNSPRYVYRAIPAQWLPLV
jgi:hypothetical protein